VKQLKIIFTSDLHIGLRSDEIDRSGEIIKILKSIVNRCKKLSKDYNVLLVIGGDIFNTNTPSEENIADFIFIMSMIKKYGINTYIIVGNHDAIANPNRLSCLSFVKKAKTAYPMIRLIEDITSIEIGVYENGPLHFLFLPHVSKALIQKKLNTKAIRKEITTQEYIDSKTKSIMKKIGSCTQVIAFSHLNIIGAHPGSEENLLKKSTVFLPDTLINPPVGVTKPTIISGHIHSHSIMDNIYIVGSPIYCSYGEKPGPKFYCEISVSNQIGKPDDIEFKETEYREFKQLELDMIGETRDFFEIPEVSNFVSGLDPIHKPFIKFDIAINPENNNYDWKSIVKKCEKYEATVKPIIPRVVMKKNVRSAAQKINLNPIDAVKVRLKKNVKDKMQMKRLYKIALKYLE